MSVRDRVLECVSVCEEKEKERERDEDESESKQEEDLGKLKSTKKKIQVDDNAEGANRFAFCD